MYARVPVWASREAFLAAVDEAAACSSWRAPRRASFVRVLRVLADVADGSTGRGVQLAADTIAERAGVARRTVFRRLADAREAGLLVDVVRGRHTFRAEREAARSTTGRRVLRVATVRALTHRAGVVGTPPHGDSRRGHRTKPVLPKRARRAGRGFARTAREDRAPRSLALQRLAAGLVAAVPGLDDGRHLGALCDGLHRALGDRVTAWSVRDVVAGTERAGWAWSLEAARDGLGWFLARLRLTLAEGASSSVERAAEARRERAERAAARAAERAADEAARASATSAAATAARSSIRAAIEAARTAARYAHA